MSLTITGVCHDHTYRPLLRSLSVILMITAADLLRNERCVKFTWNPQCNCETCMLSYITGMGHKGEKKLHFPECFEIEHLLRHGDSQSRTLETQTLDALLPSAHFTEDRRAQCRYWDRARQRSFREKPLQVLSKVQSRDANGQ